MRRPEGPGFWESIAWLVGVHIVQAGAAMVAVVGLAMVYVVTHPFAPPPDSAPGTRFDFGAYFRAMGPWFEGEMTTIFGIAGLATVLYGTAAVSLRLHRQGGLGALGLKLPSAGHMGLIVLAMLPLSLLCTELQKLMLAALPHGDNDLLQIVFSRLAKASFPQFLWAIAIAPALGEELICRGLIGRGLIARWGVVPGVLVTSVLFGIMHINPAQAVAVIPLGIAMHFVYLTTRSFWAPVLLHLLNNAFAAFVLKYGEDWQINKLLDEGQAAPWHLMVVAAAMVTALGLLLWQTRVQYARADGTVVPPSGSGGVPVSQSPQLLLLACGAFNSLAFAAVLWQLATGL
jgi:membrane protease YdiL (CAAX protease family)